MFSIDPQKRVGRDRLAKRSHRTQHSDLLERIDALSVVALMYCFSVTENFANTTALVNRYTKENVRFVVGRSLLVCVWEFRHAKLAGSSVGN